MNRELAISNNNGAVEALTPTMTTTERVAAGQAVVETVTDSLFRTIQVAAMQLKKEMGFAIEAYALESKHSMLRMIEGQLVKLAEEYGQTKSAIGQMMLKVRIKACTSGLVECFLEANPEAGKTSEGRQKVEEKFKKIVKAIIRPESADEGKDGKKKKKDKES